MSRPFELPPRQSGSSVWMGEEKRTDAGNWSWRLSDRHTDEIVSASAPYAHGGDTLPPITADVFPLPTLRPRLDELRRDLVSGRGFGLIRGFPLADLPARQSAAAFLGLGAHIGSPRSQNAAGHLLGHVRDVGLDATDPAVRIYQTDQRQTFHTDSADVVGLLCLEAAQSGGSSLLVSAAAIYNEMLERSPELVAELFEPVATDRRGEVPAGAAPFYEIPVLNWYDGVLTVMYQRQYIESAQRFDDAPRLTEAHIAALDLFDDIANDGRFHLEMQLEPGDMQFVHNHSLLHDRTAFLNKPDSPRHLLRLWLSVEGDRELPASFAQRLGSTMVGDRGGIVTDGTTMHAPVI